MRPEQQPLLEEKEKLKRIGLQRLIEELYPRTRGNQVPNFVTRIASDIENFVSLDPFNSITSETGRKSFLGIRGSAVKRLNLGTPPGYWHVSEPYEGISQSDRQNYDELTKKVVDRLSTGPRDIDFIFRPRGDITAKDIYHAINESLHYLGFTVIEQIPDKASLKQGDYDVAINYFEFGDKITPPVQGITVSFSYKGQHVLNTDFVKYPKNEEIYNNFRLVGCIAPFDIASFAYIHKTKDGKMIVDYETLLNEIFGGPSLVTLYSQTSPDTFLNSYNARVRVAYQLTLWFSNFKNQPQAYFGDYSLSRILDQMIQGWLHKYPITKDKWLEHLCQEASFNKLEGRLPDIISGFLVGLAYDPFLFSKLAYESGLFSFLPIGEYISSPEDLLKITSLMAGNYGSKHAGEHSYILYERLYTMDPTNTLPQLSHAYQSNALSPSPSYKDITKTGPFIFLRALNQILEEKGQAPFEESMTTIVNLFNPMIFYLQNRTEGIPVNLESRSYLKQ